MERYIVIPINRMITNSDIFYASDDINEAYLEYLYENKLNRCCIINTKDMKIVGGNSIRMQLFIAYKYNTFIGAYENKYLEYFINKKNRNYELYNYKGELMESVNNSKIKENLEKPKKKNTVSIEIKGLDKLAEVDQVKTLEAYLSTLREHGFNNAKISDEYFKDLRFTVRKTFDENEQDYYTDLETAKTTCPPGYSVFDVLTGKCVYVKEKSIDYLKKESEEGMKYKEAWDKLKEFLEDRKDTYLACADILYVETYQTVLNAMKDFEGELCNGTEK